MSSMQTTTKDGTKIQVEGLPELPSTPIIAPPSNKTMDQALTQAQKDLESHKSKLDSHGQYVVKSAQGLLDATQTLISEKNQEERFQRLIRFTEGSAKGMSTEGLQQAARNLMGRASGVGSKISNDATDTLSYVRETMLNLATSTEFRSLAIEFLDFLQAMLGRVKTSIKEQDPSEPLGKQSFKRARIFEDEDEMNGEINDKLNIVLKHIGSNPQYQKVVENFLKYSDDVYDRLYRATKSESGDLKETEDLRKILDEAWEILHDFTGRDSNTVPKLRKEVKSTLERLRSDNELTEWGREFRRFLTDLMANPESSQKMTEETKKIVHRGQSLIDKYREDLDRIYSHARNVFQTIQDDPAIQQFQGQLQQLVRDLSHNSQGQPDLFVMEKSMTVIKNLLVERFRKMLVDVPIRRVVINSSAMDLELTNLTLEGNGLVPDNINIELTSLSHIQLTADTDSITKFRIRIAADHINPCFRGLKFDLNKKSFPALQDNGIADLSFEGQGLCTDVVVEFEFISNQISKAKLTTCTATIERVNLKIEEQKHFIIGPLFNPVIQTNIRRRMETGVKQFLETKIYQIIKQLNDWFRTRPFETMMRKGNEGLHAAQRNIEELKQRGNEGIQDVQRTIEKSRQGMTGEKSFDKGEKKSSNDSLNLKQQQGSMELGHDLKQGDTKSSSGDKSDVMKEVLQEVKQDHDLKHVETNDKSHPILPQGDEIHDLKQGEKKSSTHDLKQGDTKSSSGDKSDVMKEVLQEVKQDHDLKHVETDDKSHPILPQGDEIHDLGKKLSGDELGGKKSSGDELGGKKSSGDELGGKKVSPIILDEGKKYGGNTKPMVDDQHLGGPEQLFKEQPSS